MTRIVVVLLLYVGFMTIVFAEPVSLRDHYRRCGREDMTTKESLASCNVVIKDDPTEHSGYYWRGLTYERAGNYKKALRDYETAVRLYKPPVGAISKRLRDIDP